MSMIPAVKITRTGIEVNEIPTDLSVLEDRMTAAEQVNMVQDTLIDANIDKISVVRGDISSLRITRDQTTIAVAALNLISVNHTSTIETVENAIELLNGTTASEAAKVLALKNAVDVIQSLNPNEINIDVVTSVLNTLEPFSNTVAANVSFTTLTTQAALDSGIAKLNVADEMSKYYAVDKTDDKSTTTEINDIVREHERTLLNTISTTATYPAALAKMAECGLLNEPQFVNGFSTMDNKLVVKMKSDNEVWEPGLRDEPTWKGGLNYDEDAQWIPYLKDDHNIDGKYAHTIDIFKPMEGDTFEDVANVFGFATMSSVGNDETQIYTGYDSNLVSMNTTPEGEMYVSFKCVKDDTKLSNVDEIRAEQMNISDVTPYATFANAHSVRATTNAAFGVDGVIEVKMSFAKMNKGIFQALWLMETGMPAGLANTFKPDDDIDDYIAIKAAARGVSDTSNVLFRYNTDISWGINGSHEIDMWEEVHGAAFPTAFSNIAWGAHSIKWEGPEEGYQGGFADPTDFNYKNTNYVKLIEDKNDGMVHTWRFERILFDETDRNGKNSKYIYSIDGQVYTEYDNSTDIGDHMYLLINLAFGSALGQSFTDSEQTAFDALANGSEIGEIKVYSIKYLTNTPERVINMRADVADILNGDTQLSANVVTDLAVQSMTDIVLFSPGASLEVDGDYYVSNNYVEGYAAYGSPGKLGMVLPSGGEFSFEAQSMDGDAEMICLFSDVPGPAALTSSGMIAVTVSNVLQRYSITLPAPADGLMYNRLDIQPPKSQLSNVMMRNFHVEAPRLPINYTLNKPINTLDFDEDCGIIAKPYEFFEPLPFAGASLVGSVFSLAAGAPPFTAFQVDVAKDDIKNALPLYFPYGGVVSFSAFSSTPVDLKFTFQKAPYPDFLPQVELDTVAVTGDVADYSIIIPPSVDELGKALTFSQILMSFDLGADVVITSDINFSYNPKKFTIDPLDFLNPPEDTAYGGALSNASTNEFLVPADAADYAGFQTLTQRGTFEMQFPVGGEIHFTVSGYTADVDVQFLVEKNPFPDTLPDQLSSLVTVTGTGNYVATIPPTGVKKFTSLLMYLRTRDVPVQLTNFSITSDI